jgi:putative ABC transport system permease protein
VTGLVGAIVEAWDELRIHKVRVLLALIGVAVAVTAITTATALIDMFKQGMAEQTDRSAGRNVTLQLYAWQRGTEPGDVAELDAQVQRAVERYGIGYATRDMYTQLTARLGGATLYVQARAVDPDFGVMYRTRTTDGRWFAAEDAQAYAPLLVVNDAMMRAIGATSVDEHPTVLVGDDEQVRATIVGVVPDQWEDEGPMAFLLYDHYARWVLGNQSWGSPGIAYAGAVAVSSGQAPTYSMWVPEDQADALGRAIRSEVAASVPEFQVELQDNRSWWRDDFDEAARWIGFGVGGFSLLLGGLGLVNISLVTVRYRIREIGIRRSFGATGGRVFFGVLMESVVATVVAGIVGVVLAVAAVKAIPLDRVFGSGGLQDVPPFPLSAAVVGMAAAVGVGALAGLLPAIRAVRAKVIDAIRY